MRYEKSRLKSETLTLVKGSLNGASRTTCRTEGEQKANRKRTTARQKPSFLALTKGNSQLITRRTQNPPLAWYHFVPVCCYEESGDLVRNCYFSVSDTDLHVGLADTGRAWKFGASRGLIYTSSFLLAPPGCWSFFSSNNLNLCIQKNQCGPHACKMKRVL